MEKALTIEDVMEHWSIKSRKTATALVAGTLNSMLIKSMVHGMSSKSIWENL